MKCKKCEMYLLDSHICWNCGFDNNSKEEPAVVKEKPVLPINNDDVLTESNKKENNNVALVEQQDIEPTLNVVEEVENNQEDFPFIEENNDGEVIVVDFSVEEKEEGPKEDEPALDEEIKNNQEDLSFLENENNYEPIIVSFTEENERVEDIIVPVLDEEDNRGESEISISKYEKFREKIKRLELKNKHFSLMLLNLALLVSMLFSKVSLIVGDNITLAKLLVGIIFNNNLGQNFMISRDSNYRLVLVSMFLIVVLILFYHIVSWKKKSKTNGFALVMQIVLFGLGILHSYQELNIPDAFYTAVDFELGFILIIYVAFFNYILIQASQLKNKNIDDKMFKKEDYLKLSENKKQVISKFYDKQIFKKIVFLYITLIIFIVGYFFYLNSTFGYFYIKLVGGLSYYPTIYGGLIGIILGSTFINVFILYQYVKGKEKFIAEGKFEKSCWFALRLILTISTLGIAIIPFAYVRKRRINIHLKKYKGEN